MDSALNGSGSDRISMPLGSPTTRVFHANDDAREFSSRTIETRGQEPTGASSTTIAKSLGVVMPEITREDIREEIKDKLAAAEARTDVKLMALSGKIDQVLTKIDGINSRFGEIRTDVGERMNEIRSDIRDDGRSTRANYWLGIAAIVTIIVALYAAFPAVVDFGMKMGEIKHGQETPKAPKSP